MTVLIVAELKAPLSGMVSMISGTTESPTELPDAYI